MLKIAILCGDGPHHAYLCTLLRLRFDVAAVVVEPGAAQLERVRQKRRWRDYAAGVYHGWRRRTFGLDDYRRRYFAVPAEWPAPPPCEQVTVDSINDPAVAALLSRTGPDVTVVIGTTILGRRVLDAAGDTIINIHGGFLPDYRGNHCFFFALRDGAWDRIGSSIHFVNEGIDTGDLVEVVRPALHPGDNAEMLYSRAEKLAIHRLAEWLGHLEHGGTLPRRPQGKRGRLYFTRDRTPLTDLLHWLRVRTGRLVVPERAAPPLPAIPARIPAPPIAPAVRELPAIIAGD